MKNSLLFLFATLFLVAAGYAQDADEPESIENESNETEEVSAAEESLATGSNRSEELLLAKESPADEVGGPKRMSGMSILGNEETPKSLVIVPWKSSEMGDELDLSDTLDDRAKPVDKEVFMRELTFYQIRGGEQK
jgi:hypothetical protein